MKPFKHPIKTLLRLSSITLETLPKYTWNAPSNLTLQMLCGLWRTKKLSQMAIPLGPAFRTWERIWTFLSKLVWIWSGFCWKVYIFHKIKERTLNITLYVVFISFKEILLKNSRIDLKSRFGPDSMGSVRERVFSCDEKLQT